MKKNYNHMYLERIENIFCPVCEKELGQTLDSVCPHVLFVFEVGYNEFIYVDDDCEEIIEQVIKAEKSKGKDEFDEDFLPGACEALKSPTTIFFTVDPQPMFSEVTTYAIDLSR